MGLIFKYIVVEYSSMGRFENLRIRRDSRLAGMAISLGEDNRLEYARLRERLAANDARRTGALEKVIARQNIVRGTNVQDLNPGQLIVFSLKNIYAEREYAVRVKAGEIWEHHLAGTYGRRLRRSSPGNK